MISFSLKLLQGILKGSKRDKWAEYCTPEKIGEVATRKVRDWFDKKSTPDGTIGEISEDEMKQLAEVSPIATATMLVAALDAPRGASDERDQNLASYMRVLEPIAQTVRDLETSIALRGFLHDTECVSYWHLRDKQGSGDAFRKSGDHLVVRGGLEVYVFSMELTDDALDALNVAIRSAASGQLPTSAYDYHQDDSVALVEEIHEQKVITRQLDSDPEAKRDPLSDINVYLAYEHFDEAEETVKQAIAGNPDEHKLKLKLLEVYYAAGNNAAFKQYARVLQSAVHGMGPLWHSALAMWQAMSPERALFAPATGGDPIVARAPPREFDISSTTADTQAPIEISWTIPSGVPGIVALLESLPIATRAQAKFTRDLAETLEKAKKK